MSDCIDAMDAAARAGAADRVTNPERLRVPLADPDAVFLVMPGSADDTPYYGAKLVGLHGANAEQGLPTIQGLVALFSQTDGAPVALFDAATITEIRTAAASALATRVLARSDASTLGVFGTGVQARAHVQAIAAVRALSEVRIWGRDHAAASRLCSDLRNETGLHVVAVSAPQEAAACDIVVCATAASEPVLHGDWLQSGAHVNLVGSHTPSAREADTEVLMRADIYVDSRAAALQEAGDLLIPIRDGDLTEADIRAELGELLLAESNGRGRAADITLYKSLGNVTQDLFAAMRILETADSVDDGTRVSLA